MRLTFDDGTLLLEDAPDSVPYAEWDDRVDEYRAQAYRYHDLHQWATPCSRCVETYLVEIDIRGSTPSSGSAPTAKATATASNSSTINCARRRRDGDHLL